YEEIRGVATMRSNRRIDIVGSEKKFIYESPVDNYYEVKSQLDSINCHRIHYRGKRAYLSKISITPIRGMLRFS
ncbi:hypothetical protein L9F63_018852, partial [Diploptera punctata]